MESVLGCVLGSGLSLAEAPLSLLCLLYSSGQCGLETRAGRHLESVTKKPAGVCLRKGLGQTFNPVSAVSSQCKSRDGLSALTPYL